MKSTLLKLMVVFGLSAGMAAVSGQALACHSCCSHGKAYGKVYVYDCGYYHRAHGCKGMFNHQGRPLIYRDGGYYIAQKCMCVKVHWKHHVHYKMYCS